MLWEMVSGILPKWAYLSWYWTSLHFPDNFSKVWLGVKGCLPSSHASSSVHVDVCPDFFHRRLQELRSLLTKLLEKNPAERMTLEQVTQSIV